MTIEERAETIARGIWEARSDTGMDTFTDLRAIVFRELAADGVRQETAREVARGPVIPPPSAYRPAVVDLGEMTYIDSGTYYFSSEGAAITRRAPYVCSCLNCHYERASAPGMKTAHDE